MKENPPGPPAIATGVLIVCFNEATKITRFLSDLNKEYIVRLKLRERTDGPYSLTWSNVVAGSYTLTVKAVAFLDQAGKVFYPARVEGLERPFRAALAGATDPKLLYTEIEKDQRYVFDLAPCFNRAGGDPNQVTGVITIIVDGVPIEADIPAYTLNLLLRSLVIFLLGMGIMGAVFGSYFAHGLVTRFNRLSSTTDLWSEGDFSRYIDDTVGDEISRFAERLNNMARQLQSLLRRRQDMAVRLPLPEPCRMQVETYWVRGQWLQTPPPRPSPSTPYVY